MTITVATSIKYGNYKYLRYAVEDITRMIEDRWASLCKRFDFDRKVRIHIRPIPGNTRGFAYSEKGKGIEIDPRYDLRTVLETLAHELVHMEQYKQKRLRLDYLGNAFWSRKRYKPSKSFQEYLDEPWEVEARARAEKYINKVWPL